MKGGGWFLLCYSCGVWDIRHVFLFISYALLPQKTGRRAQRQGQVMLQRIACEVVEHASQLNQSRRFSKAHIYLHFLLVNGVVDVNPSSILNSSLIHLIYANRNGPGTEQAAPPGCLETYVELATANTNLTAYPSRESVAAVPASGKKSLAPDQKILYLRRDH